MDQKGLRMAEARCTQEAMPKCRAKCPLRLDVRAFMEKVAQGDAKEARKVLEKHLPLPGIVARICDHPCEDACLRRDLGGSLAVGGLEKWCVEAAEQQSRPLPRGKKSAAVAVLGRGLAGLTVAFELSRKGFPVTVYGDGEGAEWIQKRFPSLPEKAALDELNLLEKAGAVFVRAKLDRELLEKAGKEAAGIFVDADESAELLDELGLRADAVTGIVCEERKLTAGGGLEESPTGARFASASRQAGEGRRAALSLERIMNGVSATAGREGEAENETRLFTPLESIRPVTAVLPAGAAYSVEEASAEAARCLRCECMACVKECVYLKKHGAYPRVYARQIYNNASIVQGQHIGNPLVNGCALCGQCTEICPEKFSMAQVCLDARQDLVERGKMPPSAHEFALEDMADACGPQSAVFYHGGAESCAWAFWPGCQLTASAGGQVLAVYEKLREVLSGGVGLFAHCCGVPAHWAGRESEFQGVLKTIQAEWAAAGKPRLIMGCAYCARIFREFLPEIGQISLWEALADRLNPSPGAFAGKSMSMQDPCGARHDPLWREKSRLLAGQAGVTVEEPPFSGSLTACCGYGGLTWNARPDLAEEMTDQRAAQLEYPALTTCVMCRDRLRQSGKESWHLLDVLNLAEEEAGQDVPGFSARRRNREHFRRQMEQRYGLPSQGEEPLDVVIISAELLDILERRHILRQDVEEAVRRVEAGRQAFVEGRSGHKIGSWRPRNVTFWVRYSPENDHFRLHDAWCHRMRVPGSGNNEGERTCP